jgi:hypothetical protein
MPVVEQLFEDIGGGPDLGQFACGQAAEMGRKIFDAALAALLKKVRALGGSADVHPAGVSAVAGDFNQMAAPKSGNDTAHGRRLNLLGGGELAQGFRSAKDENREGRELRGPYAGDGILFADPAQQVDGNGMKTVGGGDGLRTARNIFGLDFSHRI